MGAPPHQADPNEAEARILSRNITTSLISDERAIEHPES